MTRQKFSEEMNPLLECLHPTLRNPLYRETIKYIAEPEKQLDSMRRLINEFSEVNDALKALDEIKRALRFIGEVVNNDH